MLLAAMLAAPASTALADRKPTADERPLIEQALRSHGYSRWGDIEIEENGRVWEVDAALAKDGRRYDLKMSSETLQVIRRKRD